MSTQGRIERSLDELYRSDPERADALGLSGQRVRDIEREAMTELRARSAQWRGFFAD